jgi:succinate-semialdehyde dehydrogenase/glutarate-semialdehyde dehydrogenase
MLYIDGKWSEAASGARFDVINPASGDIVGQAADGGQADARAAIAAAHKAFEPWSRLTAYQRSAYLYRAWEIMTARKPDLAKVMTAEQGKPLRAALAEVQYAADFLLWFAEESKRVYGETIPAQRPDQRFVVLRQPLGVAAAITPWNYPISMVTRKLAPALAAGCTMVVKPAEDTPLCAVEVFKILAEAKLPAGVANLVTAGEPTAVAEEFLTQSTVRKLTFTGSTEVGRLLARRAADQIKRVSLELGGHAPFIVFEDADPVHAAKGAVLVKFLNTGQACICPNRIFVHRRHAEAFTKEFTVRANALKVGSGFDDAVRIGPLVNAAALDKMQAQVADALDKGAVLCCGGRRLTDSGLDKGFFYAPTVLTHVTARMRIFREETFGPVAPIIVFDGEDEVLDMANDTIYGLAAYVYTPDLSRALRTAERLRFGIIGVNDINPTAAAAPFGGMQQSGIGREGGREGIAEYLDTKLVGIAVAPGSGQ